MILKNMAKVFATLMIFTALGCANASKQTHELILSKKISLHYQQPESISHSWRLIIFKYPDWYFSHQTVDPKTMYSGIDLTGLLQGFIRSMFEKESFEQLPASWLQELSKEQASVLGITEQSSSKINRDFGTIYHVYDKSSDEGQIYILEEKQTHWLQVNSNQEQFKELISNIKER